MTAEVRAALPRDLPGVAALRWRWVTEGRADRSAETERDAFIRSFSEWAVANAATHSCSVVVDGVDSVGGSEVVGMAWLAQTARPPSPGRDDRRSGDLQSVYVVPELRGRGWGARLVAHTLQAAAARGVEHVTVHSSSAAIALYRRAGFTDDPRLLMTDL